MLYRRARLLIYEYDTFEALERDMGRSLPEGIRKLPYGEIKVVDIPERLIRLMGEWAHEASERLSGESNLVDRSESGGDPGGVPEAAVPRV